MTIRNPKAKEQLCQPRRSVAAPICAHIGAASFSCVALGLAGIPPYAQQDINEAGMT